MLALPIALGFGCQNNTVKLEFDTDGNGTVGNMDTMSSGDDETIPDGGPMDLPPTMPPIPGNWLLAVSTTIDPSLPFQFLVLAEEIGPGIFNLTMTPLSLELGSTTAPRQAVGEPKIFYGVPLSPNTGFEIFTGPMAIPGAANPITGSDTTVDILLSGMPSGRPFCGAVTGSVVSPTPLDLGGSTFGTEKVDGIASLPPTFATSC